MILDQTEHDFLIKSAKKTFAGLPEWMDEWIGAVRLWWKITVS